MADSHVVPAGVIRAHIQGCTCPWCGAGPFLVLARHTQSKHGIDRERLRELAGLGYTSSVCDPQHSARCADRPQMKDTTRLSSAPKPARHRVSEYALASKRRAQRAKDPAMVAAQLLAANSHANAPEAKVKRRATWLARTDHGTRSMYRTFGCRCQVCRDANAKAHRDYVASRRSSE